MQIEPADPASDGARWCIDSYFAELERREPGRLGPATAVSAKPEELVEPAGCFLVAYRDGEPIGCGGVKYHGDWAELKRMWVAPEARGLGVGRRLLTELEALAQTHGAKATRLDTNATLVEAITMYRNSGYREIEPFTDEPFADLWFEKRLS